MFVLLQDYLKKLNKSLDKKNIETPDDIKEDDKFSEDLSDNNLVEEPEQPNKKTKKELKKEKKEERKRQKREKKKKYLSIYSLLLFILFTFVCMSKVFLLNSSESYILAGQLIYDSKTNKYSINYDIEILWNDNMIEVGEKICIPSSYTSDYSAVRNYKGKCIKGEVIEAGNKVKINYELPKYISLEELKLYMPKEELYKNFNRIQVKINYFANMYQIVNITPLT